MSDESPEERQKDELVSLQSIYPNLVRDLRANSAWKIWRPNDFLLTLQPLHNSAIEGIHCSVTLRFCCCHEYPDKPPTIEIHEHKGLSIENASKLLDHLKDLSQQKCGEVMIFELAEYTRQYLHDHNKPTLSFYDEMLKQQNEKEELIKQEKQEERKKIKDEIQKRHEIYIAGRQQIGVQKNGNSTEMNSDEGLSDAPELVFYADSNVSPVKKVPRDRSVNISCTCNLDILQTLKISQRKNNKVYIGKCLGHSSNGATTYLAIEDSGEHLICKKWSIPAASEFQTRTRQMELLRQDLKSMCRLQHSSLVPYIAMEMFKENKRTPTQSVYIFRNYILGSSLKYLIEKCKCSDKYEVLKLVRHIGLGVFSALTELHSVNVLHRDVRCENVYLDDLGAVKLVGAGLDLRLAEMLEGENYCESQSQAQDIYAAAQLLLSMIAQERNSHEIPPELPSAAKDFFSKCITEDSQWSAEKLVSHAFLVDAPTKQPSNKQTGDAGSGSDDDEAVLKVRNIIPVTNGHSRLMDEFEELAWLGQGAFGDVLKVKNKLDGGFYALKRVKLNPENVQLNRKITREVKLLSRLNHENVVRYYNAWIESITAVDDGDESSSYSVVKTPTRKKPGDSLEGVVAKLGQEVKLEWSMCEGTGPKRISSDSEEDVDDDEQLPLFKMSPEDESSSSIEFAGDSDNKSETIPSEALPDTPRPQSIRLNQVLYIQMEFCEKHTLRQAIDNCLYQEHIRAWRLFREIVEGLAHVHQRGMIHRDLKPVNIFLDSNDHVKIGDFGLATKAFTGLPVDEQAKPEEIRGSLTGQVGTALYLAPELLQSTGKGIYNQKVDIYSLGIILFEMFHPPLSTGMERAKVLNNLRTKDILMPNDFKTDENTKQIYVIRWLLRHDPRERPTCAELLGSSHVPRAVPEGALAGLVSHALSERARNYQRLVAACLHQRPSPAEDYTYHKDMRTRPNDLLSVVKGNVIKVFHSHGATEFSPPLLTPRAKSWEQHPKAVAVMTASGTVCHLPHDLRLPFARHTAYSATKYMRRYVVDRIYREKHVAGFHPREIVECAFDIVTPQRELNFLCIVVADAELLVVASRAASECNLKVTLQLNHALLLQTLLLSCGVPLDKHADIYPVLVQVGLGRITRLQLQTHLESLCISSRDKTNLLRLMEADVPFSELKEIVYDSKLKSAKWSKKINQALEELETVYVNAKALGCECPMTVAPFLAYNAMQHNGVFWQMSVIRQWEHKPNAKQLSGDLIAAGGRYDALVDEFWEVARTEKDQNEQLKSSSVGFSMSLERIVAILKKMEVDLPPTVKDIESTLICVYVSGKAGNSKEGREASMCAEVARELWAGGQRCAGWPAGEPRDLARAALVLQPAGACLRATFWADRVIETKLAYHEVIDFVKQKLNPTIPRTPDGTSNRSLNTNDTEKTNNITCSITFITAKDECMNKNTKRLLENQIHTAVTSLAASLGVAGRARACVLALGCGAAALRALAAHTELSALRAARPARPAAPFIKNQDVLEDALEVLTVIANQNNQNRSTDETQLIILYSIPDSLCKIVT
ncbi:eIF-2-alpha kinase GCN2 [Achroia grisella]|uniref:eIF-2-alpha kinase GCN2 n=1 Tax=Achroia grisella TaxID=688607 RepID=UPI0027D264CF|nr:eIF-2-alpha kinase GCN2 [Achroia grisella]